jgi:hypothetical protein
MKHLVQSACMALALLLGVGAHASTQALGFEIGATTIDDVKAKLSNQTTVTDNGINKFSMGPMFKTDGAGYEVAGLESVVYIFDDKNTLAAILLTLQKNSFDSVFNGIYEKYPPVSEQRLAEADQFARFKTANAMINMDAPMESNDLKVSYIRFDLLEKFTTAANDSASKRKRR